jgi:hypothetical protein
MFPLVCSKTTPLLLPTWTKKFVVYGQRDKRCLSGCHGLVAPLLASSKVISTIIY